MARHFVYKAGLRTTELLRANPQHVFSYEFLHKATASSCKKICYTDLGLKERHMCRYESHLFASTRPCQFFPSSPASFIDEAFHPIRHRLTRIQIT